MNHDQGFSESQKQYLSGFVLGADLAKSLPRPTQTAVKQSRSPDQLALDAQQQCEASGKKLCAEELAKRAKHGLDTWDDIAARSLRNEFPQKTDVFLQKYHGLFYVAPAQNAYMCRLRLPGGVLRDWQLVGLADVVQEIAGGSVDVTTRANLQIREIAASHGMDLLYRLRELDLITTGSGADNIRNITCSTLSGLDKYEWIETLPLAKRMHHYILNHREMYGLPRKFNIAFEGGGAIGCVNDTNDIGFIAARVNESAVPQETSAEVYFLLTLGGITGHRDFAKSTCVLVTPNETIELAAAIVRIFIKHGDRSDRRKARLKYLLDQWGIERFLSAVEEELGKKLLRVSPQSIELPKQENRFAHVGFHPQKQLGFCYVGVALPVGRIAAYQMRGLAEIARKYGNGEIRLTVWQNLIIPNIPVDDKELVAKELLALDLDYRASAFRAGLVACTGSAGCKYAAANTKLHAIELATRLETEFALDQPLNIHLTGCHHSCAQHYIGDIGLLACQVERDDETFDGYHLHVGGGWGEHQQIARLLFSSLSVSEVQEVIRSLLAEYLQHRLPQETFASFSARYSDDELKKMAMPKDSSMSPT